MRTSHLHDSETESGLKERGHTGILLGTEREAAHSIGAYSGLGVTSGAGVAELASDRIVPLLLPRTAPQKL